MTDAGGETRSADGDEQTQAREARVFVVLAIGGGFPAWDLGFDLGAFDNVDHRRYWAIWVLCTVALAASYLFRKTDFGQIGQWRWVLAVPSLWLIIDLAYLEENTVLTSGLLVLSAFTVPLALVLLARLLVGDFFRLSSTTQLALGALLVGIFAVGLYVGSNHPRFLTCDDFARAGDFVPEGCTPS
ncbi:MAG: hypothetical protein AAF467_00765 [Actinomycetota bacterium]